MESQNGKPTTITNVKEFVRAVALLGGFMGRKGDGSHGVKALWQGLQRLEDLVTGYRLAAPSEM